MKKFAKIFALLLIAVALISSIGSASANEVIVVKMDEFSAYRGQNFSTTLYVDTPCTELDFTISVDENYATLVGVSSFSSDVTYTVNEGSVRVRYSADTPNTERFDLIELTCLADEQVGIQKTNAWLKVVDIKNAEISCADMVIRKLGDVFDNKNDGKINARDASRILQHVARISYLSGTELYYANAYEDYNADGSPKINARDASVILQYVAHIKKDIEKRYDVTFKDADGKVIVVRSVKANEMAKPIVVNESGIGKVCWATESGEAYDFTEPVDQDITLLMHYTENDGGVYKEDENKTYYTCKICGCVNTADGLPNRVITTTESNTPEDGEDLSRYYKYRLKINKNEDGRYIERVATKTYYKTGEFNNYNFDGASDFEYIGSLYSKELYTTDFCFVNERSCRDSFATAEFNAAEFNKMVFNFLRFIYISTEGALELSFEYDTSFMYQVKGMKYGVRGKFVVENVKEGFTNLSTVRDLLSSNYVSGATYLQVYKSLMGMEFGFMGANDSTTGLNKGDYSYCDIKVGIPLLAVDNENEFWSFTLTQSDMIQY